MPPSLPCPFFLFFLYTHPQSLCFFYFPANRFPPFLPTPLNTTYHWSTPAPPHFLFSFFFNFLSSTNLMKTTCNSVAVCLGSTPFIQQSTLYCDSPHQLLLFHVAVCSRTTTKILVLLFRGFAHSLRRNFHYFGTRLRMYLPTFSLHLLAVPAQEPCVKFVSSTKLLVSREAA